MAADKKSADYVKRRPTSAPKSTLNVMTSSTIPVIVLDNKKDATSSASPVLSSSDQQLAACQRTPLSSSSSSSSHVVAHSSSSPKISSSHSTSHKHNSTTLTSSRNHATASCPNDDKNDTRTPTINIHPSRPQASIRSSSDVGIPAASMPNLALQMGIGDSGAEGGGDNYLGVYCSPRTTRRSVDLDMKETTPGQHEWMEALDSSANSLKVLTSSSRVGSALSLNSECTTRSIGLLSNDSDSEEFSQSDKPSESGGKSSSGQGQLRRYLSYPEEGQSPESSTRPSQSLSNLKSANCSPSLSQDRYLQRQSLDYSEVAEIETTKVPAEDDPVVQHSNIKKKKEKVSNPKEDTCSVSKESLVECITAEVDKTTMEHFKDRKCNAVSPAVHTSTASAKRVIGSVRTANNNNMLCYRCDTNSPSREGRIRQWLQDMDTTQNNDFID